jgi:hypothetical protein
VTGDWCDGDYYGRGDSVARSMGSMWERDGTGECGLDGEMVDVNGKRTHDE